MNDVGQGDGQPVTTRIGLKIASGPGASALWPLPTLRCKWIFRPRECPPKASLLPPCPFPQHAEAMQGPTRSLMDSAIVLEISALSLEAALCCVPLDGPPLALLSLLPLY